MQTLTGSLFPINVEGIIVDADRQGRYMEIPRTDTTRIFERLGLRESDLAQNLLGLWNNIPLNGDKTVKFATLKAPEHVLRARQNGCVWEPKGRIRQNMDEFPTCPNEVQMELCPDAYWNTCWEKIYGNGNGVRDLMGTPEGAALMQTVIGLAYDGVGNSLSEQVHFANHPFIEAANTEGFYSDNNGGGTDEEAWADYYEQQTSIDCAGIITTIDALADEGVNGYANEIPDADIDPITDEYTGDIEALFNTLINQAKGAFAQWIKYGAAVRNVRPEQNILYRQMGGKAFPIILCTKPEFQAYEDSLITKFGTIPNVYQFYMSKDSGDGLMLPGVLRYKGLPVVCWDEVSTFDSIVGTKSHRVAIAAPGVFGLAYDVDDLAMFRGIGMRITQKLEAPYMGKIFMDTTFRIGQGLIDRDFFVMAKNIRVPDEA